MAFRNRIDAGRQLAARLGTVDGDVVVLGLPRGGVPVAAEVACALEAPLDVILVRKLGVPGQPELAMGAIGEGGVQVANEDVIRTAGVTERQWSAVVDAERSELERRAQQFRGDRPRVDVAGRIAVLVDDGVATGATAFAACQVARALGAARVLLAVPVASAGAVEALRDAADEIVSLETPRAFYAVGEWYDDFSPTTDEEVVRVLGRSSEPAAPRGAIATDIEVAAGSVRLAGRLTVPAEASGIVVFAHGSGSSRHSPRNQLVADALNRAGLGTLLFDLLTPEEEGDRANVFDIGLLGRRLVDVTRWIEANPATRHLGVAYFGASTGAGAALWAAAEPDLDIAAVVSRGGRPDLAGPRLAAVRAPTLLIVGGLDEQVLALNQRAAGQLRCDHRVAVVPGATHLFEEPGTLHAAAELAREWFTSHPSRAATPTGTVAACPRCGTRNHVPPTTAGTPICAACHSALPWIVEVGDADFGSAIATRMPVLVALWAAADSPRPPIAPSVERGAHELAGRLKVLTVNVDEAPTVARHLGVDSVPTLLVLRDGRIIGRQVGPISEDRLLEWVRAIVGRSAA